MPKSWKGVLSSVERAVQPYGDVRVHREAVLKLMRANKRLTVLSALRKARKAAR